MKIGVPPINIFISMLYILVTALSFYWLKLSHRKKLQAASHSRISQRQQVKEVNFNKLFGVSWAKKYTLIGSCFNSNRKFIINEVFILSAYAAACLNINKIIIWPVALVFFLLPASLAGMEVGVGWIEEKLRERKEKSKNQVVTNIGQQDIQIQAVNLQSTNPMQIQQVNIHQQVEVLQERSLVEIGFVSTLTFITFLLFYKAIFYMTNSISNSGELNVSSLLIILSIDQFAIRPALGLAIFAILKILQHRNSIQFSQNMLVNLVCRDELTKIIIQLERQRMKRESEDTSGTLKHIHNPTITKQVKQEGSQLEHIQCLNLINLQPETFSNAEHHHDGEDVQGVQDGQDALQRQVYLTTPQKQLFEGHEQSQQDIKQRSILHSIIDNKQNQTVHNQFNKSTIKSHQQSKGIEDLISNKDDHLNDLENLKTDFNLQNSRQDRVGKKAKKKAAKRVLKLTGNSPYLQYLPNMLKNIDKVKNGQKEKKML